VLLVASVFGLEMSEAVGTSLLVVAALSVPTLATHWALGHIAWPTAAAFAGGAVPTSAVSARLAQGVGGQTVRRGVRVVADLFGAAFVAFRLASA
jgi:uncharacterized protein